MLECLGCGKAFAEHELDAGKCTECRKRKVDLTSQQLYDHQQNTQIRSAQQEYEKQQQAQWKKDYHQEVELQENEPPQDALHSSVDCLITNATERSHAEQPSSGARKIDYDHHL